MKTIAISNLARGAPEARGSEPLLVSCDGSVVGVYFPLGACQSLSERSRRELWRAMIAVRGGEPRRAPPTKRSSTTSWRQDGSPCYREEEAS